MGSRTKNLATAVKPVPAKDASDEPSKNSVAPAHLADPTGARTSFPSIHAAIVALQRQATLNRFEALLKKHPAYKAARMVGSSVTNIWRWRKAYAQRGLPGLRPHTDRCGRRSPFRDIRLTVAAVRELELLHVEHGPRLAWKKFAASTNCPPLVALCVRRMGRPPALLASVGRVQAVDATCLMSADGRRLYVKLPTRATVTTRLVIPPKP